MKTLTAEQIADIRKRIEFTADDVCTIDAADLDKLLTVAGSSIPRPIADAPRDGTTIVAFCPTFYRGKGGHVVALFQDGDWWAVPGAFKIIPTHFYTIPGKGEM